MKKEKKFFNLINKDVPEKEWEAKYLIEKAKDITNMTFLIIATLLLTIILLIFLMVAAGTIQCSGSVEFEGKGNIVLNEAELDSTIEKFEFQEGKVKIQGTMPCSFFTRYGLYGGN